MTDVVAKLWGFCHTLRQGGVNYGEYIDQITFLLFLKMADERAIKVPAGCEWRSLSECSGTELLDHYVDVLRKLSKTPGILGDIYAEAQSRFRKAVDLKQLVTAIDEVAWTSLDVDIKAAAYEGLLEKAAAEGKKGAGQFFTPRVLIKAIVECMKPDPRQGTDFKICDPAVGSGGFLVAAYEWIRDKTKGAFDRETAKRLKTRTYFGHEIDARPRRMALMNVYLHNIEPQIHLVDAIYDPPGSDRFDVILTNPPFGTRGANQAPERDDFTVATSNKQLNFVQHVLTVLRPGGRAAMVLPDNVLFADQAGEVMKMLADDCDLHTVLRLPRGTFTPYSQGVKANVIFFTKGYPTENVWIYDARTNVPGITKKDRPLTREHFAEFVKCFGVDPNGKSKRKSGDSKDDRWRSFHVTEVAKREFKLDGFKWLKEESLEDSDDLPPPEDLATEAISELEEAVGELGAVLALLEDGDQAKPKKKATRA